MTLKELLKKKFFYLNILLALLIIFLIGFFTLKWLNSYTRHGENVILPDFVGKPLDSLVEYVDANDMRYIVMDSVFDDSKPKGSIVLQNPLPNSSIKIGRTIYVSVVSQQPEMSVLPNLENLSVRQGVNLLLNSNLEVKELVFQKGFDRNAIQKVTFEEETIEAGTKLLKNSAVTIYVSKGTLAQNELVPDLIDLPEKEAKNIILSNSFNIGKVEYENYNPDGKFYVYYQFPKKNAAMPLGQKINIRLTSDNTNKEKLTEEAELLYDSTYYADPIDSTLQFIDSIEAENEDFELDEE